MTPNQQRLSAHRQRKVAARRKEAAKFKDGKGHERAKASKDRATPQPTPKQPEQKT